MSITFSNIYNENKPTKVDFEKRVNLKDLMNEDLLLMIQQSNIILFKQKTIAFSKQ